MMSQDDINSLMSEMEDIAEDSSADNIESSSTDVDEVIEGLDDISLEEDLLNEDSIVDDVEEIVKSEPTESTAAWMDEKIQKGDFPLPVEKEHKVVNQLSKVTEDDEEKATEILDILSYLSSNSSNILSESSQVNSFLDEQEALLNQLTSKFPNVGVFKSSLLQLEEAKSANSNITTTANETNNEIFRAMELMQFHDINRQKIERVMAVIRKLTHYLNNLFEDEHGKAEISTAKHIHGDDSNELVDDDDIEALINEFSKDIR